MRITFSSLVLVALTLLCTLGGCEQGMPEAEQTRVLEQYVTLWNTGTYDGIDLILHRDFELRMSPTFEPVEGVDRFMESVSRWRTAYPDFTIRLDDVVHDDSSAAAIWTITATNTGPGSHPPTGKRIDIQGISVIHFREGKIVDEWIASNDLLWIEQLGYVLIPPKEFQ